jgi:hypothetical protein
MKYNEAHQRDRQTRAAYLNDMRKLYRARRDIFGTIVQWEHKAGKYKIPAPLAWNYWQAARSAPPPF